MDNAQRARALETLVGPGDWDVRHSHRAGAAVMDVRLVRSWSFPVGVRVEEIARTIASDLKPARAPLNQMRAWQHPVHDFRWSTTRSSVTFKGERIEGCVWPTVVELDARTLRPDGTSQVLGRWDVSVRDCQLTAAQIQRFSEGHGLLTFMHDGVERACQAWAQHVSSKPDPVTRERGFVVFRCASEPQGERL